MYSILASSNPEILANDDYYFPSPQTCQIIIVQSAVEIIRLLKSSEYLYAIMFDTDLLTDTSPKVTTQLGTLIKAKLDSDSTQILILGSEDFRKKALLDAIFGIKSHIYR